MQSSESWQHRCWGKGKALMVTVHVQRDHSHLQVSPVPLGVPAVAASHSKPCSHLRVPCSSCQPGRGSLEPGMLLNTTRTCLLPLCSPFPTEHKLCEVQEPLWCQQEQNYSQLVSATCSCPASAKTASSPECPAVGNPKAAQSRQFLVWKGEKHSSSCLGAECVMQEVSRTNVCLSFPVPSSLKSPLLHSSSMMLMNINSTLSPFICHPFSPSKLMQI